MSPLAKILRASLLWAVVLCASCGDDDEDSSVDSAGAIDAGSLLDSGLALPGDAGLADAASATDPLYLIGSNVQTSSESILYLWASKQLEGAKLDFRQAIELTGATEALPYQGYVYVPNSEKSIITRYELRDGQLIEGPAVSFAGQGFMYLSYAGTILSAERAFLVNDKQFQIVEWNPTTMTITKMHDISPLKREGWGNEYRGGFLRSDGKFILHWTYTNDRKEFINSLQIAVWDTATGALNIEEDTTCPTSAGFGGYFDEQEDLYLIADSFGLFTQFGGFPDPKPACIVRLKKGETKLDPTFKQHPSEAMGGQFPWGFYYLGNGLAFTSGIDPAVPAKHDSVFETLFAPEHEGWLLDVKAGTAKKIANLPRDGVGFESHRMDGRLFVPRTTGSVTIENITSMESTLFEIKPDATAVPVLMLPGYISPVARIR